MTSTPYQRGLHDVGDSVYAYLQPDGSWGWSNAGLIVDSDQSMLVDTLFDLHLTRRMLDDMQRASPAAGHIDTVINTHANGDHCWGNELVAGARIIASTACAEEMDELPPQMLAQLMKAAPTMGDMGQYLAALFGDFDFEGITLTKPTETFHGQLDVTVGTKEVRLLEVGPAHTRGDIIVHVPADRVVFTGDILFHQAHPIIWAGPVSSWLQACRTIIDLDPEVVVPGHGALTNLDSVRQLMTYLEYLHAECKQRYQAGMPMAEAARDIAMDTFASWSEQDRILANVNAIYRELGAQDVAGDVMELFGAMARLARERGLYGLT